MRLSGSTEEDAVVERIVPCLQPVVWRNHQMLLLHRLAGIVDRLAAQHDGMDGHWLGKFDDGLVVVQISFHTLTN